MELYVRKKPLERSKAARLIISEELADIIGLAEKTRFGKNMVLAEITSTGRMNVVVKDAKTGKAKRVTVGQYMKELYGVNVRVEPKRCHNRKTYTSYCMIYPMGTDGHNRKTDAERQRESRSKRKERAQRASRRKAKATTEAAPRVTPVKKKTPADIEEDRKRYEQVVAKSKEDEARSLQRVEDYLAKHTKNPQAG